MERAAAFGQPAIGLTDHGVMNGAVELYKAWKKAGIKPILGFEAYLVDDSRTEAVRYERNHLTLLASTDEGFRNLVKLTSAGFLEGYKRGKAERRPRPPVAPLEGRHRRSRAACSRASAAAWWTTTRPRRARTSTT